MPYRHARDLHWTVRVSDERERIFQLILRLQNERSDLILQRSLRVQVGSGRSLNTGHDRWVVDEDLDDLPQQHFLRLLSVEGLQREEIRADRLVTRDINQHFSLTQARDQRDEV